ncbi:MAG: exodeoxyribonuclease VII large subunit [Clostridiales bacterium 41_12_two_minus]|nr:MAG: exodeoxyribonuclease VII large subunit [Clostridiales bacterium 41_12_two_minus]
MKILSVSQVNMYIKALLDEIPQVKNVYICGEISNFKHYYNSGHMYFTLKDDKSQLKAVMFKNDNYRLKFTPENGMKVICFGQVGVYERDGVYQLYCRDMQPDGVGALTIAFEQLKVQLAQEGLFDEEHKKAIPKFPQKIGVATSKMGAAVEDIKNVISRRYPLCEIIIVPTMVQGESAAQDIADSIRFIDENLGVDTIIVGRGGGSLEDLWAFNTEIVARAVYACKTPIISAVGHETDFTISDFVSDMRAPTPSAAAELAVPDIKSLIFQLNNFSVSIEKSLDFKISQCENSIKRYKDFFSKSNVDMIYANIRDKMAQYNEKFKDSITRIIENQTNTLSKNAEMLDNLSPLKILSRGYSVVKNEKSDIVTDSENINVGDNVEIILSNGAFKATVNEVTK